MFTASVLGTNLGDVGVDTLSLGRWMSFVLLAVICSLAIGADSRFGRHTDAYFWIAIVGLRAAATNVADALTHDFGLGYGATALSLAALALVAGRLTRPGSTGGGSPLIDRRYWGAMLIAGVFGTVSGDMASHTFGLYAAACVLTAGLVLVLVLRHRVFPAAILGYWCAVLLERCAATPVGDSLASRHALGLGLPLATACSASVFMLALVWRWTARRARD
jgi:uncharacterized membrane-anchored protein